MRKAAPAKTRRSPVHVFCNGVSDPHGRKRNCKRLVLEYRPGKTQNMKLLLPDFIRSVFHLPDRVQDLLEIAAYVFCADRHISRGARDDLEYHSWSREFKYYIRVRDADFWNDERVRNNLREALIWMTGDRDHTFAFSPGHFTPPADMWDREENALTVNGCPRVVLFSGGLDSLAGIVELLESTTDPVWPISHRSANPSTIRTQESLIEALKRNYHGRINYRVLECHLHGVRAPEESQRTRAFLYCSMGFAMAVALRQSSLIVYENGVTALNLPKRTGMLNARASRTAHPKTLRLLQDLYSLVGERSFDIGSPFASKTKSDVFSLIRDRGRLIFLNSSVSCSKTYKPLAQATHCGGCSQCIDRRFAAHAADCDSTDDASAYAFDFINESVCDGEVRTGIVDYLRQARYFLHANVDNFQDRYASELADALDSNRDEVQQVEALHTLCQRHGGQVQQAAQKMFKPLNDYPEGSLKTLLLQSDFARPPVLPLALQIAVEAEEFIRRAYTTEKPRNENDLNEKIDGFLSSHKKRFKSEHPCLSFATAKTIPDHSNQALDLLIETKYIRGSTSPSKVTEGIAADLTKYPGESLKLFLVYDPDGQIADRTTFKNDFERKGNCIVHII